MEGRHRSRSRPAASGRLRGRAPTPPTCGSPLTNDAGGTVSLGAPVNDQDSTTLTTNNGSFSVGGGAALSLSGSSSFTQSGGSLALTGTLSTSGGTWTQSGGTESGNPVDFTGGSIVDSAGTGGLEVTSGNPTLSGTIPSGQTVTVSGAATSTILSISGNVTVDGTLAQVTSPSGYSMVNPSSGTPTVTVASGGEWTTSGTSTNPAYMRVALTNDAGGTVSLGAPVNDQDSTTLTTNNGSFSVGGGAALSLSGSSSFTQSGGSLALTGTLSTSGGTWTQSGGTESGNPVEFTGGRIVDSAGTGGLEVTSGNPTLSGTIPSGQTVTVSGAATSTILSISGNVTVDGTLAQVTSPSGSSMVNPSSGTPTVTVVSGGEWTTSGTSTNPAYMRVALTNETGGTVSLGAPVNDQDSTTATMNSGTLQITDGAHLSLSGSSTLTNNGTGTLGVTVDATSGVSGISASGGSITLAGTISVSTVGSPTLGTTYAAITGPISGTFSAFSFGPHYYVVTYPANEVQLEIEQGFTSAVTPFSPAENESITPQVASIGDANDEPGTYTATVNYGDGSGVQPATVNITGTTGTVTGPAHTYTSPGTDTVTVVISNTSGTTETATDNVTVTGPTITGFSKTSVAPGKKLKTVVSGTGFDGTGAPSGFSTNNPNVTVTKVKYKKATKKKPNVTYQVTLSVAKTATAGTFSVILTQNGTDPGKYTAVNAITIT